MDTSKPIKFKYSDRNCKIQFRCSEALYYRFSTYCYKNRRSKTSVGSEAIERFLAEEEKKE